MYSQNTTDYSADYSAPNDIYITKQQRRKAEFFKIIGLIGAIILVFSPFLNFATIHLRASADNTLMNFGQDESTLLEDHNDGEGADEYTSDEWISVKLNYGLDLFELRILGSNFTSLSEYDKSDMEDLVQVNEELEDELVYNMYWEMYGISIDESGIEEALDIINFSALGYVALCFVPYAIIIAGILMLLFSIMDIRTGKILCSLVALAGYIWLFVSTNSFLEIIGPGGVIMAIGIMICIICALGSLSVRRKRG